jgi:hypothetical protein
LFGIALPWQRLTNAFVDVSVQWEGINQADPQGAVQTEMTLLGFGKPVEPKPVDDEKLRQAPSKVFSSMNTFVQLN